MCSAYVNVPCSDFIFVFLKFMKYTRITPNNNSNCHNNKLLSKLIILLQFQFYHKFLPSDSHQNYAIVL
jgi:hypothetical protein